ncbi:hypothetical protein [Shewanella sp.]|jgi:hypothetical protein|uniref:hypothetical protein n=1 Tax=Shewanella sp. TaxID=50422 RepID=UPI004047BBF6
MMKDWLKKLFCKTTAVKTNKVQIDMRYEVHSFKSGDTTTQTPSAVEPTANPSLSSSQKPTK